LTSHFFQFSITPAANFAAGINDTSGTGGKFPADVVDTGGKFANCVIHTGLISVVHLELCISPSENFRKKSKSPIVMIYEKT
jgi:hypothetical protein